MTNGLSRATSIMYMRRAGLSWETIIKIIGHLEEKDNGKAVE